MICYHHIAEELSRIYDGVSVPECQVVVQAYVFLKKLPMSGRPSRAAVSLAFNSITARQICGNYVPLNPADKISKSNNKIPLSNLQSEDYDQSELFDSVQDKKPFWDRFQWLSDPIFAKLRSRVMELAASAGLSGRWFTPDEINRIADEPLFGFHDPSGHHRYMKNSHVLCQEVWVPIELLPSPEEIEAARCELSHATEEAYTRAVTLLSGKFIPHDQHEYTLMVKCSSCNSTYAPQCLVCESALCNQCRNILYPYKDDDGEVIQKDPHPVQCECTKHAFYLGLMRARKSTRIYHSDWHFGKENDSITPLGAVVYTTRPFHFSRHEPDGTGLWGRCLHQQLRHQHANYLRWEKILGASRRK